MGWQDRKYEPGEGGGGFRPVVRRIFGGGENPMDWAITMYRAWGIRVRVHLVFVIMIAFELIQSIARDQMGLPYVAQGLTALFVLVLLHEYGHCIACRRVGGSANDILMWPLGGLAFCAPPHHWKADLITTIGGPAVNAILWPVLGLVLVAMGQPRDAILFNPFNPWFALSSLHTTPGVYWPVVTVWWFYYTNALLFCFNALLPMYPMDGGRIVHALLWRKLGHRKALSISANMGLGAAVVLILVAVKMSSMTLVGIAFFGGLTCFQERRRLAMTAEDGSFMGYNFDGGYSTLPAEREPVQSEKARQKKLKQEQDDQEELDRILAKIAKTGMGSLSRGEKKWLEQASQRRRVG